MPRRERKPSALQSLSVAFDHREANLARQRHSGRALLKPAPQKRYFAVTCIASDGEPSTEITRGTIEPAKDCVTAN